MTEDKKRLDLWLVDLGKAPSRSKAQELIAAGKVSLFEQVLNKSNKLLSADQANDLVLTDQERSDCFYTVCSAS